jgi:hypothetical protein
LSGSVLLITTITGSIVAILNTRTNAAAIAEAKEEIDKLTGALVAAQHSLQLQTTLARQNIILLGESTSSLRSDNAKLALVFNQLYNDFERVTGTKPPVDFQLLKEMRNLDYITGPLPHLEIK